MPRETLKPPPRLTGDNDEDLRSLTEYLHLVYQNIQVDLVLNETLDAFEARIAVIEIALLGVEAKFNELAAIGALDQDISPAYSESEVQAISDKVDEVIAKFSLT